MKQNTVDPQAQSSNDRILHLFEELHAGKITPEAALQTFKFLPYEDLGFAKADTHRQIRTGFPEAIFSLGKTADQVISIGEKLLEAHGYFVATRASAELGTALKDAFREVDYRDIARMAIVGKPPKKILVTGVGLLTAGTSDISVAEEAAVIAELMGNQVDRMYDVGAAGIHRLLDQRKRIEECKVLIVVAGMDGVLPTLAAGLFGKPIIAVPTSVGYGSNFEGLSALLTMLNSCALGIAVVNIDNGFGAGYFAAKLNGSMR